jgi:hypothetical protein
MDASGKKIEARGRVQVLRVNPRGSSGSSVIKGRGPRPSGAERDRYERTKARVARSTKRSQITRVGRSRQQRASLRGCIDSLRQLTKSLDLQKMSAHHGGMLVLGGFTIVDTRELLTEALYPELLREYRKLVPKDPSATQQSFYLRLGSVEPGVIPDLMRAHRDLCLHALNASDSGWIAQDSSLLLLSEQVQATFHDHLSFDERADPRHRVCRQNAVASLHRDGTIFNSPNGDDPLPTRAGDTAIFNEGAKHKSPLGAKDGFFMLHWFVKPT